MVRIITTLLALMLVLPACDDKKSDTSNASATNTKAPSGTKATNADEAKADDAKADKAETDESMQWVSSQYYGVKFRAPKRWKVTADGEAVSTTSPDGAITILLVGTESDGVLTAAIEAVKEKLEFKDVKLAKDSQTVLNGMPGHTAEGSAVLVQEGADQEIQFILNAVQPGDKGVAMMVFAEAEMYEAKKEELQGITKTLQKM